MKHMRGAAAVMAVLLLTLTGCASTEFAAVNTEPGYYYGFGTGPTETAAQTAAFQDLVYNTFTQSGSLKSDPRLKANLTQEMKAALAPLAPKPFQTEKKTESSFSAVYRVKFADWTKAETARLAGLQTNLGGRFQTVSGAAQPLGTRLIEAARITQAVAANGVTRTLRAGDADTPLLADAVAQWAKAQLASATFSFQPGSGLLTAGQPVTVTLTAAGKPLVGLPVSAVWATETASPAIAAVTDAQGSVSVPYPKDEKFRNAKSVLRVATRVASLVPEASVLTGIDAGLKAEAPYRNAVVLVSVKTDEVHIDGGTFTVGSVKQDRRAGSNERPRIATVAGFFIDRTPVTNAQYRAFLETTDIPKDQWPDFLDTDDQGGPDQPVVGVSLADAQKYAQWVSGVLGVTKRLPTEEEYEVAARAGQSTIYPWGDQPPTDGVRANYAGNKRFGTTSPVGSFTNGANPLGLLDLVGNVWEWTPSPPPTGMTADPGTVIIKGGSWLDGPSELRISNHRAVDPAETASDRGFRLIRSEEP